MKGEKKPVVGRFDYEGLAGDLDAACSTETGQEAEERRNEAGSRLRDFLWEACIDFDVMASVTPKPDRLAEATRRLALLYRLVHSRRWELPPEEDTRRQATLEKIADEAGLPNLHFQLREFMQDIGHAILVSPDPVTKLARILHGPPKRGRKKRSFRGSIEIAVDVEKLHATGMTLAKAYESVASSLGKSENVTSDAVRIVHEKAMKDRANASLVHLVAAGEVEF
jgi:hypothetical protein